MRLIGIILIGISLSVVLATWLERRGSSGPAADSALFSSEIRIVGAGNTLASVARQVNDPQIFSYDPVRRTAVTRSTLIIEGQLQLGRENDPAFDEYLELATEMCGDLRIEVRPSGVLRLYHSGVRTVSQVLSSTSCSRGYALFVDGELTMIHSRVQYISGSTSQCLRGKARATIRQSTFSYCDGSALSCINVDGRNIVLENSELVGSGSWGLVVQGSGGAAVEAKNCVLDGAIGAVFLTGESPKVRLLDCVFDPAKIVFNQPGGEVSIAWTRRVQVVDAQSKAPLERLRVRAEMPVDGERLMEAWTDAEGMAEIAFTERIVRSRSATGTRPAAPRARHQLAVLREDGQTLATIADLDVQGKDTKPLVVEVNNARGPQRKAAAR